MPDYGSRILRQTQILRIDSLLKRSLGYGCGPSLYLCQGCVEWCTSLPAPVSTTHVSVCVVIAGAYRYGDRWFFGASIWTMCSGLDDVCLFGLAVIGPRFLPLLALLRPIDRRGILWPRSTSGVHNIEPKIDSSLGR
jgi:hypothetical protein